MMSLPFDPLRRELYSSTDLFDGFDASDPDSYARCADIQVLRFFFGNGKNPTADDRVGMLEALHDNAISQATQKLLRSFQSVVAIMGGHKMVRNLQPYSDIAHISYELARSGFLIVSGGGPGAMEAAHLGAAFSATTAAELDTAIARLSAQPDLPTDAQKLVSEDGSVNYQVARALHAWIAPAFAIVSELGEAIAPSLAIPTWLYGYEPTSPLATYIAKYFQNSIREDGLVTIGVHGIIYAEGGAGTLQEIFQDAAQNYYGNVFSPMVFLSGPTKPNEHHWEAKLPVRPLIEKLLGGKPEFAKKVLFTDSVHDLVKFILAQ